MVGFQQVGSSSNTFQKLSLSFAASAAGYLYIYVSNESSLDVNVYFDDMKITHKSDLSVIQADDYFPLGAASITTKEWLQKRIITSLIKVQARKLS